jgi:histidyl-tRNA synthetase
MAKPTVSLPQGTRDFGPDTVRKRNYIFSVIRYVFEKYGFQPLETPAMENLDTLMGKYGEEGDRLIFKILNNGLGDPTNIEKSKKGFELALQGKNSKELTERALRYDLTIPFARYVAMNQAKLHFPFRRYQLQPVWRADRPQRGRYREFYQCDADVVGSKSLLNEVELASVYAEVFKKLSLKVAIKLNNRKILAALAAASAGADKLTDITVAIDKLDKIGLEKVEEELKAKGLGEDQVTIIRRYLNIAGNNNEKLASLDKLLGAEPLAREGLEELRWILDFLAATSGSDLPIEIDFTLARGLNYYTGTIFEVKSLDVQMGSIGGGGRYDDLTGLFGVPGIPGVGISFGVDRIYDVLEELNAFPEEVQTGTDVLFFNLGEKECQAAFQLAGILRENGIRCELYHEAVKFDKQFKYAEKRQIPFVIIIGSQELQDRKCTIKDLRNGQQVSVSFDNLSSFSFL